MELVFPLAFTEAEQLGKVKRTEIKIMQLQVAVLVSLYPPSQA